MGDLRPRQVKAIDDVRAAYRAGFRAPVLVAATGFGKTHTASEIVMRSVALGKRVWFLAHLRELLDDTSAKLRERGIPHGFVMAGMGISNRRQVQVVSVQTAIRRLEKLERPDLIIVDEAHLAVAATYQRIFEWAQAGPKFWKPGGALLLHLTATPERLDGRGLGEVADVIVPTCTTAELIDDGLLSPIRYFAPQIQNLSGMKSVAGDYAKDQLSAFMDKPAIVGSAVAHYRKLAHGKPAIAFCCSIQHAEHTAEQFRSAGYRSVSVSGESDSQERREALAGLRDGRLDVVCNCALWVAGVDAPNVACIILLCPTRSLTKYLQSVGRGLRIADGKESLCVLDHANLAMMHGLPTDDRDWTLTGDIDAKRARSDTESAVRQCPSCFAVSPAMYSECRECREPFPVKYRTVDEVEGELTEIEIAQARKVARIEQASAQTLEALIEVGKARGYKNPAGWARFVFQARNRKRA